VVRRSGDPHWRMTFEREPANLARSGCPFPEMPWPLAPPGQAQGGDGEGPLAGRRESSRGRRGKTCPCDGQHSLLSTHRDFSVSGHLLK